MMLKEPKRSGLRDLARLHDLDIDGLIRLLATLLRNYGWRSQEVATATNDLTSTRARKKQLAARLNTMKTAFDGEGLEALALELESLEEQERDLDGSRIRLEREREVYEKALAASLRVLDVRRVELQVRANATR